jgi:hypothetical protein
MWTLTDTALSQMDEFEHTNTALYLIGYEQQAFKVIKDGNIDDLTGIV